MRPLKKQKGKKFFKVCSVFVIAAQLLYYALVSLQMPSAQAVTKLNFVKFVPTQAAVVTPVEGSLFSWKNADNALTADLGAHAVSDEFTEGNSGILFPVTDPALSAPATTEEDDAARLKDWGGLSGAEGTAGGDAGVMNENTDAVPETVAVPEQEAAFAQTTPLPPSPEENLPLMEEGASAEAASASGAATGEVPALPGQDFVLQPDGQVGSKNGEVNAQANNFSADPHELSPSSAVGSASVLAPAPALEFFDFARQEDVDGPSGTGTPESLGIKVSMASILAPLSHLTLEYALASSTWESAGTLGLGQQLSNGVNGGYFDFSIPAGLYKDLSRLRLRLTYLTSQAQGEQGLTSDVLKIDGVWVEAGFVSHDGGGEELNGPEDPAEGRLPETFSHIDFLNSLMSLSMPADLSSPITLSAAARGGLASTTLQMLIKEVSASATTTRIANVVTYENAFLNTDLKYELKNKVLKEDIILKAPEHPESFSYELNLQQYDYTLSENMLVLYKKGHRGESLYKLYTISAPVMTDAKGDVSSELFFELAGNTLTLVPDAQWLSQASYPVDIDPTVEISVINVHSHPIAGERWNIDFTTAGTADLTIAAADQATADDMQFENLQCGSEDKTPGVQKLDQGVLLYPGWSCEEVATVSFLDLKTGNHHMVFDFGGATADAFNSTVIWSGAGGDTNWNNGANWVGGVVPGAADLAVFDSSCGATCNATVNVSTSTGGISLAAGFTGTVTQATNTIFTVGSSGFSIASGTWVSSASTTSTSMVLSGPFSQTGGSFVAPAGTMKINDYNFTVSGGAFSHNSGTVNLSDSDAFASQTVTCGSAVFNKVTITHTNGKALVIGSTCSIPLGSSPVSQFRNLTNNGTITVNSGTWSQNLSSGFLGFIGTLTNNGAIVHNGTGWTSTGSFTAGTPTSTVSYAGTTATFSGMSVSSSTFPSGITLTLQDHDNFDAGSLSCQGVNFAKVILSRTNASAFTIAAGCTVPLGANPTSTIASLTNNGTIVIDSGTWTQNGVAFVTGGSITNNGSIVHNGTGWNASGSFTMGTATSTVTYAGTSASFGGNLNVATGTFPSGLSVTFVDATGNAIASVLTPGSVTFGSLTVNKTSGSSFTFASSTTLNGNLSLLAGSVANPSASTTVTVSGNLSQSSAATFGGANLLINLAGAAASTISKTAGTFASPFVVAKTATSTQLASVFASAGAGATCTVSSGTFDLNGNNFTCGSAFSVASGAALVLAGSEASVTAPALASGTTVVYKGDGSGTASTVSGFKNWPYYDLTISTTDSGDTVDGSSLATTTVLGTLTLASGYFTTPASLTVAGNIFNTGGNLSGTSGTVVLGGTGQQLTGSTNFYNLTKNVTAADTLTFAAGSLTTINGTMDLQGTAGNLLFLRSTVSGSQWIINPVGTRNISYLDVKDSNNTGSAILSSPYNITNSGNNLNWGFDHWTQSQFRFFANADALQPASAIGSLSATTTITGTSSPIRLRVNLQVADSGIATSSLAFKLQVGTSTSGTWMSIGTSVPAGGWWDGSWQNRRKITFNNASSTANLADFPVLVSLSAAAGNIDYSKTKAGGADIRFVDADGVTALNYEIEKWDASATSTVWVRVPQVDASSTTDYMWMYYNNPSASDNSTTTGVWDNTFAMVAHLSETSGTLINDSSRFDNDAAKASASLPTATTTAQIGGAQSFNGSSAYISRGNISIANNITVSAWVYSGNFSQSGMVVEKDPVNSSWSLFFESGLLKWRGGSTATVSTGTPANSQWHYVAATQSGTSASLYVDGRLAASGSVTALGNASSTVNIGRFSTGFFFNGLIDEVRISSSTRSTDWLQAEYKTESGIFNTYAAEEAAASSHFIFYNNASVSSSATISSLLLPASNVAGTYQETNPTAVNPYAVTAGQYIEYDFALSPQNLVSGTTYYFRMVRSDGTVLDTYGAYPSLTFIPENAPDAPGSLGPAAVVSGGWTNTTVPSFTFTLSDPDVADTVKYEIQISTSSSFSAYVTDYVSALAAQGPRTFTVGQAAGGGTYYAGSQGTVLADSSSGYYWRVFAIDSSGAFSAVSTANSGAVAFKIDTASPAAGSLAATSTASSAISVSISGASDALSGLAASSYAYYNLTSSTGSGATSGTSSAFTGLMANTQYSFIASVTDAAGNAATTATATLYTLAATPTALATTSVLQTAIALNWDGDGNPVGTSFVAENVTAGTSATTTATSTVFSSLACGTSYTFRVKALNGDGVSSDYASDIVQSTAACNNAPDAPSSLGPASVIGGGWVNTGAPAFNFALTDSDVADTVQYRIQIATTSDYSSVVLDAASILQAQGSATYTAASALADSAAYYWRVMAIDNSGATSTFATANSGQIAFKVDATAPTAGTLSLGSVSTSSIVATLSGASDALSGLATAAYLFSNVTAGTNSAATSSVSWLSVSLSPNTPYVFLAEVSDVAGNSATTITASAYTLANVPTGAQATADSQTQVTVSWNASSNPNGTEYYALNTTASTTPGWITATSTIFTGLSCNTSYSFTIKARNGDGIETVTTSPVSATTQACAPVTPPPTGGGGGGGGSYPTPPPGGFRVLINNNASTTATSSVILTLVAGSDAKYMMVSSRADFSGATIEPYVAAKDWSLCAVNTSCPDGTYTVYAKFYSASMLSSSPVSDSISYIKSSSPTPFVPPFSVSLLGSANQKTWAGSLQNVTVGQKISLKADLSLSSVSQNVSYEFDCSSDGKFDRLKDTVKRVSYTARNICSFPAAGIYTARVLVSYNGYTAMSTAVIAVGTVTPNPPPPPTYTTCQNNACVIVSGNGTDSCHTNFDCSPLPPPSHSVCQNSACVIVSGAGSNQCSINSDCQPPVVPPATHAVCQNEACMIVEGAGADECSGPAVCQVVPPATHTVCQNLSCVAVSGEGLNECSSNFDCSPLPPPSHSVCQNSACVVVPGAGTNNCAIDNDCQFTPAQTHSVCQNFACVIVSGPGGDQCSADSECTTFVPPPVIPPVASSTPTPPVDEPRVPSGGSGTASPGSLVVVHPVSPQPDILVATGSTFGEVIIGSPAGALPLQGGKEDGIFNSVAGVVQKGGNYAAQGAAFGLQILAGAEKLVLKAVSGGSQAAIETVGDERLQPDLWAGVGTIAIAPVTLALQYSLGTGGLFFGTLSLTELWLVLLRMLYGLLTFLGLRAKRVPWGTVYDSVTKQPLDPAIVSLVNFETGQVAEQCITDLAGRFGFLRRPGKYLIRVQKTHYQFPSVMVAGRTDGVYTQLYHGELMEIRDANDVVTPNIPMDPLAFDWNQQDKQRLVKFYPRLEWLLHIFLETVFWAGALLSLLLFASRPTIFNGLMTGVYACLVVLRHFLLYPRLWGQVASKKQAVGGLLIEMSPAAVPQVVVFRAVTADSGRFFLKTQPGDYLLRVKRVTGEVVQMLGAKRIKVTKEGTLNSTIDLDSLSGRS